MATEAASLDSAPHAVMSAGVSSRTLLCCRRLPLLLLPLPPLLLLPALPWLLPPLLPPAALLPPPPLLLPPHPSSRSRLPVKRCRETPSAACFNSSYTAN